MRGKALLLFVPRALAGLALGLTLVAHPSEAAQQRPFGGPAPVKGTVGPEFSRRCHTPELSCQLRIPHPVGMRCHCRLEGERISGRIR